MKRVYLVRLSGDTALVSVDPTDAERSYVRVAQWASARDMEAGAPASGPTFGPFPNAELPQRVQDVVTQLSGEGWFETKSASLIGRLQEDDATIVGRAAVRLQWRRAGEATEALLAAAEGARSTLCPIVDALGWIGDLRGEALVTELAQKKNLARRRSGVEALRSLWRATRDAGVKAALDEAIEKARARLPETVQVALASVDVSRVRPDAIETVMTSIEGVDARRHGLIADTLYELDTPLGNALARRLIKVETLPRPHSFRYTKSILKRAMLRQDAQTFAWVAYAVERASFGNTGQKAELKSGLTGKKMKTHVFSKRTQLYVRRACWRYLRDLAKWQPELYTEFAARLLSHYRDGDQTPPKKRRGAWAEAFLLQRIAFGRSERIRVEWQTLRTHFRKDVSTGAPPTRREESFPALWDAHPGPSFRLLCKAKSLPAQDFAIAVLRRDPSPMHAAPVKELASLWRVERKEVEALASGEFSRRFDAARSAGTMPWDLVDALFQSGAKAARPLCREWLKIVAPLLVADPARCLRYLCGDDAFLRSALATELGPLLQDGDAQTRRTLASAIMPFVLAYEGGSSEIGPLMQVVQTALLNDFGDHPTEALAAFVRGENAAQRQLGALLIAARPDARTTLSGDELRTMAQSEWAAVRRSAVSILERDSSAAAISKDDAALWLSLVECEWDDVQGPAIEVIHSFEFRLLGLEGVIALCDSTREPVQEFGRLLVVRHFQELDPEEVLHRLSEHPAQHVRLFTLTLIEDHLPPSYVALARLEGFFRRCLLDPRPRRDLKVSLLALLTKRALSDERQAELVAGLLGLILRTSTVFDFQRVAESLATISMAFPNLALALHVRPGQTPPLSETPITETT